MNSYVVYLSFLWNLSIMCLQSSDTLLSENTPGYQKKKKKKRSREGSTLDSETAAKNVSSMNLPRVGILAPTTHANTNSSMHAPYVLDFPVPLRYA